MSNAIVVHETGGPEVLCYESVIVPRPASGEVRVRQTAIGVNYSDIYYRSGLYSNPLPFTPGREAVGVVEELGPNVWDLNVGDKVGYVLIQGSYTDVRNLKCTQLIKLPDDLDDDVMAAVLLKGLTAEYLSHRTHVIKAGEWILVHAAAGGVGSLLCQWAAHLGANVIGTVSRENKIDIAQRNGCCRVINRSGIDIASAVEEITKGQKVAVVYDAIGRDTFHQSVRCLRPFGLMILYGQASGIVNNFEINSLGRNGSLYLTRPLLSSYLAVEDVAADMSSNLFEALRSRWLHVNVNGVYPLMDAHIAHQDLEAGRTTGSIILKP